MNKIFTQVYENVKIVLFSVIVAIFINVFIFEPYSVKGSSMEPTFHGVNPYVEEEDDVADRVFVLKIPQHFNSVPEYEDVIIIDSRVERKRTIKDEFLDNTLISLALDRKNENLWIKRVIGKEGDTIEFKDGNVYRNGEKLEEPYTSEPIYGQFETVVVPEDHVYVLGDNRNKSSDSRLIGAVPLENIRGTVLFRYYPFDKWSTF